MSLTRRWPDQDRYDVPVYAAANRYGVRPALVKAVIGIESGFVQTAMGSTGDYGLMQMIEPTARGLGYTGPMIELLNNPTLAIDLGTRLLAENLRRSPSVTDSVSAYNGGWRPTLGYGSRLPNGTYANQAYVDRVLSAVAYFEQWEGQKNGAPVSTGSFRSPGSVPADPIRRDTIPVALPWWPWWKRILWRIKTWWQA